jgi:hypothetical protein
VFVWLINQPCFALVSVQPMESESATPSKHKITQTCQHFNSNSFLPRTKKTTFIGSNVKQRSVISGMSLKQQTISSPTAPLQPNSKKPLSMK